ncbi:MAG: hypothetical protein ACTSX4_04625 [Candidatus Helarchaeota archaeon]
MNQKKFRLKLFVILTIFFFLFPLFSIFSEFYPNSQLFNNSSIPIPDDNNLTKNEILPDVGTGNSLPAEQWVKGNRDNYANVNLMGYLTGNEASEPWNIPNGYTLRSVDINVKNLRRNITYLQKSYTNYNEIVNNGTWVRGDYTKTHDQKDNPNNNDIIEYDSVVDGSYKRLDIIFTINASDYIANFDSNNVVNVSLRTYSRCNTNTINIYISNAGGWQDTITDVPLSPTTYGWTQWSDSSNLNDHFDTQNCTQIRFHRQVSVISLDYTLFLDYLEYTIYYRNVTDESITPINCNLQVRMDSGSFQDFNSNNISSITSLSSTGTTYFNFRINNLGGNPNSTHQIDANFDLNFTYQINSSSKQSQTTYILANDEISNQTWNVTLNLDTPTGQFARNFSMTIPDSWDVDSIKLYDPSQADRTSDANIFHWSHYWVVQLPTDKCDILGNWVVQSGSLNMFKDKPIGFYKNGNWISTPYYEPSDYVRFNASLNFSISNPSDRQANISVFDSNNQLVFERSNSAIVSGSYLLFWSGGSPDWTISDIVGGNNPGNYTVSLSYFNGTEIGFKNSSFLCKFKSNITKLSPFGEDDPFDWSPDSDLNVKVRYYNESDYSEGIDDASYTNWTFGNSTNPIFFTNTLTNIGGEPGNYSATITSAQLSTLNFDLTYQLNITLDSPKHQRKEVSYDVILKYSSTIDLRVVNFTGSWDLNENDYLYSLYPENITLFTNYSKTSDGSGISSATVTCTVAGGAPQTLSEIGSTGNYTINLFSNDTIPFSASMDSPISIHIEARSAGFQTSTFDFVWYVVNASTTLINYNSSTLEVMGGSTFKLMLRYNDTSHEDTTRYWINDCDASNVTVRWGNTTMQEKNIESFNLLNSNGTYEINIKFDVYQKLNFNLSINFQRVGYNIATFIYNLTVKVYNTSVMNLNWENVITLYENLDFSFLYQHNLSGSWVPITDSNFILNSNLSVQGFNHFGSGTYNATLISNHQTTGLNAGNYVANVSLNKTNNEFYDFTFNFMIRNNHTISNITNTEYQDYIMIGENRYYQIKSYINQSINFTTFYKNNELDQVGIDNNSLYLNASLYQGSTIVKSWNDNIYIGGGNYNITLNQTGLQAGDYVLNISFKKLNYDWGFIFVNLTIEPWCSNVTLLNTTTFNLVVGNDLTNWFQHNISFRVSWYCTVYNKTSPYLGISQLVSNITPHFGKAVWSIKDSSNVTKIIGQELVFSSLEKVWHVNSSDLPIPLKDVQGSGDFLSPGNYKLYVNITGAFLNNVSVIFNLIIKPKAQSHVDILGLPSQTMVGTFLTIRIKLTIDGEVPLNYYEQIINLTVIINYDDGHVEVLNLAFDNIHTDGTDQKQVQVSIGMSKITIRVQYFGKDEDWPSYSASNFDSGTIDISVGNILKILIPILIASSIGISGFVVFTIYRSKVKHKREQKLLEKSEEVFKYFYDLINIRKIFVVNKNNYEILFAQNFNKTDLPINVQEEILTKVMNLGDGNDYHSSIDVIRHDGLIIITDDALYVRTIFIMEELPTEGFLRGIVKFVQYYELNNLLDIKKGIELKDGLETHLLLESIFDISIIEPHRVTLKGINMKLNSIQTEMLSIAHEMSRDGYFFISALFDKLKSESLLPELSIFGEISLLIQKKAIERIPYDELGKKVLKYYEPIKKKTVEEEFIIEEEEKEEEITEIKETPIQEEEEEHVIESIKDIRVNVEDFEESGVTSEEDEGDELTPFEKMKLEHKLTPEEEKILSEFGDETVIDIPGITDESGIQLPKAEDDDEGGLKLPKPEDGDEDEGELKLPKPEDED